MTDNQKSKKRTRPDGAQQTPLQWFWGFLRQYRLRLAFGFFLTTLISVLAIIYPVISGQIVDQVIVGGQHALLGRMLGFLILVTALRSVLRYFYQLIFESTSQGVLYKMRDTLYRRLMMEDFTFYNKNRTGDLMSRQTGDMDAIRQFVAYTIYAIYENILLFAFALFMIFSVNTKLALAMLVILPITAYTTYRQGKAVKPAFHRIRECFSSLNTYVQENISGNRVVRAFAKEDYEMGRFNAENDKYMDSEMKAAAIWVKYVPIFELLSNVLMIILMLYGGYLTMRGEMTLGNLVTINGYLWMLTVPLRFCGWWINDIQRFVASLEKIYRVYREEPAVRNLCRPEAEQAADDIRQSKTEQATRGVSQSKQAKAGQAERGVRQVNTEQAARIGTGSQPEAETSAVQPVVRPFIQGNVEFCDVSYNIEGEDILRDVSFAVKKGQTVGVIGATGAGKSTVMNLICRFYDVTGGEVRIDGVNVKNYDLHDLRARIGIAMQDVFLFSDTIEGNIAYGRPDCPFDEVKQAAIMADANHFIRSLPEGYDTIVGERGVGLSGGQKQRISLARALLKKPSILILDDTTSAVDMETESYIQSQLKKLKNSCTIFVIAHRISSIIDADLILVLDQGRIAERGTHEQLLAKNGYYASVFRNQYGDFERFVGEN